MAKSAKPLATNNTHFTKKEIEERKEQEEKLKGNDNLVYSLPAGLTTKKEKDLYNYLVTELKASGILNNLDVEILSQTVASIIHMREANKLIKQHGLVLYREDGSGQKNPAVQVYKDYQQIFYQCCMQLGLSPASRAKLSVINMNDKITKEDPLLKALKGDDTE
ncbi:phage terminase, small subunit, putative, P27 family [Clostridium acidisoli DSM 12555]|uniref:Phage terminase, small subunit, putative, P27 family n=1 Tax=Clostridium acidisoli DSM 12555 TaxID=1121291 RepID=A0A1W1X5Z0_9CLOT|nr:phage terminase small subunit P27 family [Clostridium acidisoli]SMC19345.1 phage terminase, small subunit, putative, P27 family [Clostridium acidisoli DSM 12555]